jgi:hypothetical protein
LRKHLDGLDRVAEELIEKEEIPGKEALEWVGVKETKTPMEKNEDSEGAPSFSTTG